MSIEQSEINRFMQRQLNAEKQAEKVTQQRREEEERQAAMLAFGDVDPSLVEAQRKIEEANAARFALRKQEKKDDKEAEERKRAVELAMAIGNGTINQSLIEEQRKLEARFTSSKKQEKPLTFSSSTPAPGGSETLIVDGKPVDVAKQLEIAKANEARFESERKKREELRKQAEQKADEELRLALEASKISDPSAGSSITHSSPAEVASAVKVESKAQAEADATKATPSDKPNTNTVGVVGSPIGGAPIVRQLSIQQQRATDRDRKEQLDEQANLMLSRLKSEAGYKPTSSDLIVKPMLLKRIKKITEGPVNGITLSAVFAQDLDADKAGARYAPLLAAVQKLATIEVAKDKAKSASVAKATS